MKILEDYRGRQVRLTDERLRHILKHRELAGMEEAVEQTLHDPELIIQSSSDEGAQLCYRLYAGTLLGDKWLCVVLKYTNDPFVLTAYLTDKPKGGKELWRKR
jgi:hypothetical protein